MNIKPSPEQVREWDIASIAYADETTDQYPCWEDARNMGLAELAAQWGADAQAPIEEPELPTPAKCEGGWGEPCVYYYTDTQMQAFADAKVRAAMAQQTTAEEPELPEAVAWLVEDVDHRHFIFRTAKPEIAVGETLTPLHTAAQMHDHYQAGVRAGMAQSQDAELEPLVREALRKAFSFGQRYLQQADSEYASDHKKSDETQLKFLALIEETIAAMQGGQQP